MFAKFMRTEAITSLITTQQMQVASTHFRSQPDTSLLICIVSLRLFNTLSKGFGRERKSYAPELTNSELAT
jgi:hypothetical protein